MRRGLPNESPLMGRHRVTPQSPTFWKLVEAFVEGSWSKLGLIVLVCFLMFRLIVVISRCIVCVCVLLSLVLLFLSIFVLLLCSLLLL